MKFKKILLLSTVTAASLMLTSCVTMNSISSSDCGRLANMADENQPFTLAGPSDIAFLRNVIGATGKPLFRVQENDELTVALLELLLQFRLGLGGQEQIYDAMMGTIEASSADNRFKWAMKNTFFRGRGEIAESGLIVRKLALQAQMLYCRSVPPSLESGGLETKKSGTGNGIADDVTNNVEEAIRETILEPDIDPDPPIDPDFPL
jgi:hypothetical protein